MASAKNIESSTSGISDWLLELGIGVAVLALCLSVWAYTQFAGASSNPARPKPVWLSVPKVMAQTSDGRMFNVKLNLRLGKEKDVGVLEPHIPAFKTMVQEAGAQVSRDEMKEQAGLARFSQVVKTSLNGYLQSQEISARVKDVAFDEVMLLP